MGGWSDPASIDEVNVNGTKNLYRAFREYGLNQWRFLFVSSLAAAGGTPATGIYDESWPAAPFSAYGKSKLSCEEFLLKHNTPSTIVRLPVVYGPRSFRGLYPIFKIGARGMELSTKKVYTIVGFVKDIARGIVQAAESPVTGGQAYYLGEDRVYSTAEICGAITAVQNRRVNRIHLPYPVLYSAASLMEMYARFRKTNPLLWRRNLTEYLNRHYRYSTEKARRDFGYKSRVPLPEGVRLTADWYRKHRHV
jgi:nucleoside-diphosphate-sugar epimerase